MKYFIYSIVILPLLTWPVLASAQIENPNHTFIPEEPAQPSFTFSGTPKVNVRADGMSIHWVTNKDSNGYVDCGLAPGQHDKWHVVGRSPGITAHSATIPLPEANQTVYCKITATSVPEGQMAVAILEIRSEQIAMVREAPAPAPSPHTVTPAPVKQPTVTTAPAPEPTFAENKHFSVSLEVEGNKQIIGSRTVVINLRVIVKSLAAATADQPQFNYKLSESPDFTGATWQPISGPVTWTFTGEEKSRALYAKVTNGREESAVVSDTFYIAEDEAANLKRLGAVAGTTALAFFATINWASLLGSAKNLKEIHEESKTVDKS
jgi:hypothetical protein